MVLHKEQFDMIKDYFLNIYNPFRISLDMAEDYNKIRFLTDEDLELYKNKLLRETETILNSKKDMSS